MYKLKKNIYILINIKRFKSDELILFYLMESNILYVFKSNLSLTQRPLVNDKLSCRA